MKLVITNLIASFLIVSLVTYLDDYLDKKEMEMISLYEWLITSKKYSEDEAEETVLRLEAGMKLPEEVKNDVKEYSRLHSIEKKIS